MVQMMIQFVPSHWIVIDSHCAVMMNVVDPLIVSDAFPSIVTVFTVESILMTL